MQPKRLNRLGVALMGLALAAAAATVAARAASGQGLAEGPSARRELRSSATIQAIDRTLRTLSLRQDDGELVEVRVPPAILVLDRLQPGDRVNVSYHQALARGLDAPAATFPASEVLEVDATNGLLRIRGRDGREHFLSVEEPELRARLLDLSPGQQIQATYSEAVATSITPQPR
jgi:hypothetical protein